MGKKNKKLLLGRRKERNRIGTGFMTHACNKNVVLLLCEVCAAGFIFE